MIETLKSMTARFIHDEEGATLVEYVLLVALIGVAAVVTISALSSHAQNTMNTAGNNMP